MDQGIQANSDQWRYDLKWNLKHTKLKNRRKESFKKKWQTIAEILEYWFDLFANMVQTHKIANKTTHPFLHALCIINGER
jgi:hypothetical protein